MKFENLKRTHTCGELKKSDAGKEIILNGWVAGQRNLGGLIFVDLRDRYGLTQVVFNPKKDDKKIMKVKTARKFWVPAINNMEKFGKWAFLEIQDIHETQNLIRAGMARGFDTIK